MQVSREKDRSCLVHQGNNFFQIPNVVCNSSFHCGRHSQALVNPAEIVVHEVQRNVVLQILDLFAESVGQSGEAAHLHSHREILAFRVTRGHIRRVRVARHPKRSASGTHRRAVMVFYARWTAVHLDQHRIVNLSAEGILNGRQIRLVAVSGELYASEQPTLEIVDEVIRRARIPRSDKPTRNEFRVRVDCRPRPHAAVTEFVNFIVWQVRVFGVTEAPNFIALDSRACQVAQVFILILSARAASFDQELDDAVNRHVHQPSRCADAVALDKTAEDLDSFFGTQLVHASSMLARASIVKGNRS
jgi:hypothetical protein